VSTLVELSERNTDKAKNLRLKVFNFVELPERNSGSKFDLELWHLVRLMHSEDAENREPLGNRRNGETHKIDQLESPLGALLLGWILRGSLSARPEGLGGTGEVAAAGEPAQSPKMTSTHLREDTSRIAADSTQGSLWQGLLRPRNGNARHPNPRPGNPARTLLSVLAVPRPRVRANDRRRTGKDNGAGIRVHTQGALRRVFSPSSVLVKTSNTTY